MSPEKYHKIPNDDHQMVVDTSINLDEDNSNHQDHGQSEYILSNKQKRPITKLHCIDIEVRKSNSTNSTTTAPGTPEEKQKVDDNNERHQDEGKLFSPQTLKTNTDRSQSSEESSIHSQCKIKNLTFESDDEEDDLGRYSFDFNHALGHHPRDGQYYRESISGVPDSPLYTQVVLPHHDASPHTSGFPHMDPLGSPRNTRVGTISEEEEQRQQHDTSPCLHRIIFTPVKGLYYNIRYARSESRRKRIERLLALPEKDSYASTVQFYMERSAVSLSSWCDLMDKGFFIFILAIVAFVVIVTNLDEEEEMSKKLWLGLGIPFFILRFSWKPLCWFVAKMLKKRREKIKKTYERVEIPRLTTTSIQIV